MINEFEVAPFLEEKILDIKPVAGGKSCAYKNLQLLSDYTLACAREHDYKAIKRCFTIVENLYEKGNNIVKNAIENVYIFSLDRIIHIEKSEQAKLLAIVPITLFTLYIKQLKGYGC